MIKLHEQSIDYLNSVFKRYKKEENHERGITLDKCVIHLYPIKDTYDENGNLSGYADSLFFRADIYDIVNFKKYSHEYHDSILFMNDTPHPIIKIFKDGSTILHFEQGIGLTFFTSISIWNKEELDRIMSNKNKKENK